MSGGASHAAAGSTARAMRFSSCGPVAARGSANYCHSWGLSSELRRSRPRIQWLATTAMIVSHRKPRMLEGALGFVRNGLGYEGLPLDGVYPFRPYS